MKPHEDENLLRNASKAGEGERRRKKVEIPMEILEQRYFQIFGLHSERAMMILHLFIYNYRAPHVCIESIFYWPIVSFFASFNPNTQIPFRRNLRKDSRAQCVKIEW